MVFNQTFSGPTTVYNIAGSLILDAKSTPTDLAREIAVARSSLDGMTDLAQPVRTAAAEALEAAQIESASPQPKGRAIKLQLETAARTLEGATDIVAKASGLAKTLFALGAWAANVLS